MMLAVITPTRGRPQRFAELVKAIRTTADRGNVTVWAGVDDDDPSDYEGSLRANLADTGITVIVRRGPRRSLCAWTNTLAREALDAPDPPQYLASLGDDHRPRTAGWDRKLIESIQDIGGGFAYGNDLFQGAALPTSWVVSADVVRALGWMMLPACEHLFVDAAILALGQNTGRIVYRPDVVIEHVHPAAGKTDWDQSYMASNAPERYTADAAAFHAWKADGMARDAAAVIAGLTAQIRG
jgi:hypothetical protein